MASADGPAPVGVSFGAAVRGVTPEIARAHGLPAAYGVEVGGVRPGSPAAPYVATRIAGDDSLLEIVEKSVRCLMLSI